MATPAVSAAVFCSDPFAYPFPDDCPSTTTTTTTTTSTTAPEENPCYDTCGTITNLRDARSSRPSRTNPSACIACVKGTSVATVCGASSGRPYDCSDVVAHKWEGKIGIPGNVDKTAAQTLNTQRAQLEQAVASGINSAGAGIGNVAPSRVELNPASDYVIAVEVALSSSSEVRNLENAENIPIQFTIRGYPNDPITTVYAGTTAWSDSDVLSEVGRSSSNSPGSTTDGDSGLAGILGGVIGGIVAIALIGYAVYRYRGGNSSPQFKPNTYANQTYENPGTAPSNGAAGGIPGWADPNVPFLSRAEAEAQLQGRGFQDGDFVVRQTHNAPHCFVITSCMGGNVHNSQIKYENGVYMYGPKRVGGTLDDVLNSLKSTVQISPPSGGQSYNIKDTAGGNVGGAGYLELMSDA
jgi:hypothetical protein